MTWKALTALSAATIALAALGFSQLSHADSPPSPAKLLNVSYDPTRELYEEVNKTFAAQWQKTTGQEVKIDTSHGGSGKQAQAVFNGLSADVVTLALAGDIDKIAEKGLLAKEWQSKLPNNSSPYTSSIVFVVRKGNPKAIKDWDSLVGPDVGVITPDPRASGGARWNYLAAWAYADRQFKGDEAQIKAFLSKLYRNVRVLDTGARGSTRTFQRGEGDVLIAWENEALLLTGQSGGEFAIVTPSLSILAEPPVAVLTKTAEKRGTAAIAEAYLKFLYTPAGQEIIAKHHYRPTDPAVLAKHAAEFPTLELVTIDKAFGGWKAASAKHFATGGTFEQILGAR